MIKPFFVILLTDPTNDGLVDTLAEIPIDVVTTRTYRFGAEVTSFPVEGGEEIGDHVRLEPNELDVEGMVSNAPLDAAGESTSPLGLRGDANAERRPGMPVRIQSAYDLLTSAYRNRQPLTIVTEYQIFDDMIITSLEIPRARDTGIALNFSLSLKHISVVYTESATLPPMDVARLKRKPRGKKTETTRQQKLRYQLQVKVEKGTMTKADADAAMAAAAAGKKP